MFRGGDDVFSPSPQPSKGKRRREEDGSDGELLKMSYKHLLPLLVKEQALRKRIRSGATAKVKDVQPDEPVDCGLLEKWKDLKIYYPSSDDPDHVELRSSHIRCLNPGERLSSEVINYYIQYIKRAEMHIEYGTKKFFMFNTFFYSKLQGALLDKDKFLWLRRCWKGVNIFQRGYIILPIHETEHWSLIIVCMPAKESNSGPIILHLDSLEIHPSAEILDTVGRYLEEEWGHLRKNPPSDISISDTIWQDLPRNIQKEKVKVPKQNSDYDSGIFVLYYIQQFIKQAPERFTRDSLDMLSRSWFRSEETSGMRRGIQRQLLELFENARVGDVMSVAAAPPLEKKKKATSAEALACAPGTDRDEEASLSTVEELLTMKAEQYEQVTEKELEASHQREMEAQRVESERLHPEVAKLKASYQREMEAQHAELGRLHAEFVKLEASNQKEMEAQRAESERLHAEVVRLEASHQREMVAQRELERLHAELAKLQAMLEQQEQVFKNVDKALTQWLGYGRGKGEPPFSSNGKRKAALDAPSAPPAKRKATSSSEGTGSPTVSAPVLAHAPATNSTLEEEEEHPSTAGFTELWVSSFPSTLVKDPASAESERDVDARQGKGRSELEAPEKMVADARGGYVPERVERLRKQVAELKAELVDAHHAYQSTKEKYEQREQFLKKVGKLFTEEIESG